MQNENFLKEVTYLDYIVLICVSVIVGILLILFAIRSVRLRRRRIRRQQQIRQLLLRQQEHEAKEQLLLGFQQMRKMQNHEEQSLVLDQPLPVPSAPTEQELLQLYDCAVPKLVDAVRSPQVEFISMTGAEAAEQGFAFRKKSKAVRITNYHGNAVQLVIPSAIDGMPVNEIGAQAFAGNQSLRRAEIPASVRKVGAETFRGAALEYCAIAAQVQELPDGMFEKCLQLTQVYLPETLCRIGVSAFAECRSLHHIAFPAKLRNVADHAFRGSGLSEMTVAPQTHLTNGTAFCHTPLHDNYQFAAGAKNENRLEILLCGSRASGTLNFPDAMEITVHRGAMEFCPAKKFDLSQCASAEVSPEAFFPCAEHNGFVTHEKHAEVIMPYQSNPTYFPPSVTVTNPDSTPYEQCALQGSWDDPKPVTVRTAAHVLASCGICGNMSGMTLIQTQEQPFTAKYHAFVTPELISLKASLSSQCEELFSSRCRSLQRVQFSENGKMITKYIPDRALIGSLHADLLKAFKGDGTYFFDRSVYDAAFLNGTYHWTDGSIRPLSQKQRLMMCFDVLRSTQREHEDPPMLYVSYLVGHLRYARKLCKKIYPTHPDYLPWLAEQDPTEWFMMMKNAEVCVK